MNGLLLETVRNQQMNILPFVQQQHCPQVTYAFVSEARARRQFEALELSEMCRIAEHVDVEQLGDIATPPYRVLLPEGAADVGTLAVHDGPFLGRRPALPYLAYQLPQPSRSRFSDCKKGHS